MKNKFSRFLKKIKRFFTSKNNKTVKSRKMLLGITISFLSVVLITAIILVATGSVGAAYRNINYINTLLTEGEIGDSEKGHHMIDDANKHNLSMKITCYDNCTNDEMYCNTFTRSTDNGTVTCTLYDSLSGFTYKSVKKGDKTTYSCDAKGDKAPAEDDIKYIIGTNSPSSIFHDYLHNGALNCYTHNNRTFLLSNKLTNDVVYVCSFKNDNKIEYAEIRKDDDIIKYTFQYK